VTVSHSYALDNALLILEILRRIPRRNYTTSAHLREQIAAGYEVTVRTVQRHLDAICSRFAIECDTRGKPFGCRWMRDRGEKVGGVEMTPLMP